MHQLYYYPGNASMAAHIALEEIGQPFALELVDRAANEHKSAQYLKLNPNGLIPLVDACVHTRARAVRCPSHSRSVLGKQPHTVRGRKRAQLMS